MRGETGAGGTSGLPSCGCNFSGSSPPRSYFVGTHVGARDLVGDAVDLGVGESLPQELELGAAGEAITDRDPQDRAVLLSDGVGAVGPALEVGGAAILCQVL